jgi:hypothetical protein
MDETHCMTNKTIKGIVLMALGTLILLHTWGWFEKWLPHLISLGALALLVYGAYILGLHHTLMAYLNKFFHKSS